MRLVHPGAAAAADARKTTAILVAIAEFILLALAVQVAGQLERAAGAGAAGSCARAAEQVNRSCA